MRTRQLIYCLIGSVEQLKTILNYNTTIKIMDTIEFPVNQIVPEIISISFTKYSSLKTEGTQCIKQARTKNKGWFWLKVVLERGRENLVFLLHAETIWRL